MAKVYTIATTIDNGTHLGLHGAHTSVKAAEAAVRKIYLETFGDEEANEFDSMDWVDLTVDGRERYVLEVDLGMFYEIIGHELV